MMEIHDTSVEVLYDFEYATKEGQKVTIKEGERLYLIKKTNTDWWQVIRSTGRRPFYVPSSYVKEISTKIKTVASQEAVNAKKVNSEVQKECVTTKLQHNDYRVTVSIKPETEPPPNQYQHQIIRSKSNTKVFLNCSDDTTPGLLKQSNVNSNESLSANSDTSDDKGTVLVLSGERGTDSGYSTVQMSGRPTAAQRCDTVAEANILEENMTESLAELAEQIKFAPKALVDTDRTMARSDSSVFGRAARQVRYTGSFKTKFERRLLTKVLSESCPEVIAYDGDDDNLAQSDRENNHIEGEASRPQTNPLFDRLERNIIKYSSSFSLKNNNVSESDPLKDSSDSVFSDKLSEGAAGGSSSESVEDRPKYVPVAKPRRLHPPLPKQQEEVIYANCLELAKKQNSSNEEVDSSESKTKDEEIVEDKTGAGGREEGTLPSGWRTHVDEETQQTCYVHSASGDKWFSSNDAEGRAYYYQENSAESTWALPDFPQPTSQHTNNNLSTADTLHVAEMSAIFNRISSIDHSARRLRSTKAYSVILPSRKDEETKNWPQLSEGKMYVLCEGPLQYTKIQDGGKRVRKNWNHAYIVLTELFLLIYKDMKAFHSLKILPELTVDLNGAEVYSGEKVSGRKHVFVVATLLGLQVALQCDNINSALHWGTIIKSTISSLPKGSDVQQKLSSITEASEEPKKGGTNIGRSKSVVFKNKDGSIEDLGVTPAERQMKIKARLKKFFHKRPTMESLVKKGIWKDESVFACFLDQACANNVPKVPMFVQKCITCIESSQENMQTDGLYRASGNLSQVQKIRLQIDQHNYSVLEKEEDVHVLTGALKLFFRELKEPLIPCKLFAKAIKASTTGNKKEKLHMFSDIIKALPVSHRDTLKFLLQHLLRVTQYQEHNRMRIANLAIVFGPTLMWPEHESLNMALDLLQQNMVIECLLNDFSVLFK